MRLAQKRFVSLTVVLLVLGIAATGGFAILGMAPAAQIAFAILLVAATLWITEAVPLFVTSFVIVLLCLVWLLEIMRDGGIEASPEAFLAPFFSDIILLFLGGFVMASGLKAFRIDEDLARWILAKTGRSVPRLILGVMGVTALLSMWLSNTATAAMMLAICVPIAQRFPKDDRYRTALLLAIPLAANVGGLGTPIGTPPNAIAMQYLTTAGSAPSFTQWLVIGVPGVVVMLGVVFAILMVLYRGSTDRVELDSGVSGRSYGRREWFVLAVCTVTVVGWITSAWHGYSSGTVCPDTGHRVLQHRRTLEQRSQGAFVGRASHDGRWALSWKSDGAQWSRRLADRTAPGRNRRSVWPGGRAQRGGMRHVVGDEQHGNREPDHASHPRPRLPPVAPRF